MSKAKNNAVVILLHTSNFISKKLGKKCQHRMSISISELKKHFETMFKKRKIFELNICKKKYYLKTTDSRWANILRTQK